MVYVKYLLIAGLFFSLGYFARKSPFEKKSPSDVTSLGMRGLINPLLDCGSSVHIDVPVKIHNLAVDIEDYVESQKKKGSIQQVSVYYRDLNNGPTFDLNVDETFTPASLLKVPVLIGYFKMLESDPGLFAKKIKYVAQVHDTPGVSQLIDPPPKLVDGVEYTVSDLVVRMVIYSDNVAAQILATSNNFNLDKVIHDLGIRFENRNGMFWITLKSYASVFRILYNSTYLSHKYSQAALELLTKVSFNNGISSGAAKDVLIAHKFGERSQDGLDQFHDCGIVYHPNRPYLLCVMTRGKGFKDLVETIQTIAQKVYKEIEKVEN